jgi:DNA end-binding protein Ku
MRRLNDIAQHYRLLAAAEAKDAGRLGNERREKKALENGSFDGRAEIQTLRLKLRLFASQRTGQIVRAQCFAVAIDSKRTIEIEEFVPKTQIDELYIRDPYYIAPDGEVGQQAFAVIREAIRKEGMVAVGKVVFTSREHIIALEARDKGMLGIKLRYPYEVRKQNDYFDEIKDEKVPKDMLDLALHIVDTKRGDFEPGKFEDQYEDALRELIEKKAKGEKIERPKQPARSNVVNLMDALRASVEAEGRGEPRKGRRGHVPAASKKSPRSHAKHKKAS